MDSSDDDDNSDISEEQEIIGKNIEEIKKPVNNKALYNPGEFAEFASTLEHNVDEVEEYIKKLIQEGAFSHLALVKYELEELNELELEPNQVELLTAIVGNNVIEALTEPVTFFTKKIQKAKDFHEFMTEIQNYIVFMLTAKNYAVVEGKLIEVSQIIQSAAYLNKKKELIIPTTRKNVYIRAGEVGVPQRIIMRAGEEILVKDLTFLPKEVKEKIMSSIKIFLQEKKIAVEDKKINRLMEEFQEEIHESV